MGYTGGFWRHSQEHWDNRAAPQKTNKKPHILGCWNVEFWNCFKSRMILKQQMVWQTISRSAVSWQSWFSPLHNVTVFWSTWKPQSLQWHSPRRALNNTQHYNNALRTCRKPPSCRCPGLHCLSCRPCASGHPKTSQPAHGQHHRKHQNVLCGRICATIPAGIFRNAAAGCRPFLL